MAAQDAGKGNGSDEPGLVTDYPLEVAVWRGGPDNVVARAAGWATRWAERNRARLDGLSANIIAAREPDADEVVLYFVPRDRARPKAEGFASLAGGLEVLGELVMTSAEAKARLDEGSIDYFDLEAALASLRTPLDEF